MTEKTDKKKKRRNKKFEIPDEYKVETNYDYFTFSCSADDALGYLGLYHLIELQNSYADDRYTEDD